MSAKHADHPGSSSPMYDYSDPKKFGRGSWMTFMIFALAADTEAERLFVCKGIRKWGSVCKCKDCKKHCLKYLEDNPPEKTVSSRYGLFDWIVTFMSAVNIRTGRPAYDRNILFKYFSDDEFAICEAGCGAADVSLEAQSSVAHKASTDDWLRKIQTEIPGLISVEPYERPSSKSKIRIVARGQGRK